MNSVLIFFRDEYLNFTITDHNKFIEDINNILDFLPDFLILENLLRVIFTEEEINKLNKSKQSFDIPGMLEHPHKFKEVNPEIYLIGKSRDKFFLKTVMSVKLAKMNYLLFS